MTFDKYSCGTKIKKDSKEKTSELIELLEKIPSRKHISNMINILKNPSSTFDIDEAIKDSVAVLQFQTDDNLKWQMIDGDLILLKVSLYEEVKEQFDSNYGKQIEALNSAQDLFPFARHVVTSWLKKHDDDPYLNVAGSGHESFNWANGSVQGLLISLNLGKEDQIKSALNHFNDIRKLNGVELKLKNTDQIFDGTGMEYQYEWQDDPKIPVTLRIWVSNSKVCKRVENGTQQKYKIVCEEA